MSLAGVIDWRPLMEFVLIRANLEQIPPPAMDGAREGELEYANNAAPLKRV